MEPRRPISKNLQAIYDSCSPEERAAFDNCKIVRSIPNPEESYEDGLNEMYDDDKEEDDFLMEGIEPDEENKYLGLAFSRSLEDESDDLDDPVWDASDFVKDENDLP